jgi:hypothetical protein
MEGREVVSGVDRFCDFGREEDSIVDSISFLGTQQNRSSSAETSIGNGCH